MKHSLYPALFLTMLLLAGCRGGMPKVGDRAPDFTVTDSDRTVALSKVEQGGKVVLLNFWATWCPPCIEETPSLVALQQRLKDKVTVVAVSVDVDDGGYHKFIRDHQVDMLTVRDDKQSTNAIYGTFQFPETYVIDRQGVIRRKFIGPVDWNDPQIDQYLSSL